MYNYIFGSLYQSLKRYSVCFLCMHSKLPKFGVKWGIASFFLMLKRDLRMKDFHEKDGIFI